MPSNRITVRLPKNLGALLRDHSRAKRQTPSDLVRVALEAYFARESTPQTAYEAAEHAGVIGRMRRAPKDLSTNPAYFEGFGKNK